MDVKDEANRVLQEIRQLMRRLKVSQRQVELQVGFSKGYLSQLLAHNMDTKLWHVIAILRALDYSPQRFFAEVYAEPYDSALEVFRQQSQPTSGETVATLETLYPEGPEWIRQLQRRVERCEVAISKLQRRRARRSSS